MKKMCRIFTLAIIACGALFYSCETTELEILENPNQLTTADPDLLLNDIQADFRTNMVVFNDRSSELTRIDYIGGRSYSTMYNSSAFDGNWNRSYSVIFANTVLLEELNTDGALDYHVGVSKIISAYNLMLLTDFIGDIPWSEVLNPLEFPNPNLDSGADVYAAALTLLNEANDILGAINETTNPIPTTVTDLYYGDDSGVVQGNSSRQSWIRLANTIKLRHALTIGDAAAFNAGIAAGNYIVDSSQDFQFNYGTAILPTVLQHQDYFADYTTSGAGIYQSNWLMETMQGPDKMDSADDDPRIRYYFFRQNSCTPGASCNPAGNGEVLSCSLQTPPPHYLANNISFCFLEDGYWGRDFGDPSGTPPDTFDRTAVGVYPAGGLFDDNRFGGLNQGVGGNGGGIEPFILASYVDFWRAEMALKAGSSGQAASFVQAGLEKSFAKTISFGALDSSRDPSFEPSAGDVTNYITTVTAQINDTSDDSWDVLAEQNFITQFGGGSEAYNFYRRTGYPTTLKPNIEPDPGVLPRTFFYPSVEVISNPNVQQRTDLTDQVFWDTNPAGPIFPIAN